MMKNSKYFEYAQQALLTMSYLWRNEVRCLGMVRIFRNYDHIVDLQDIAISLNGNDITIWGFCLVRV